VFRKMSSSLISHSCTSVIGLLFVIFKSILLDPFAVS